MPSYSAGLTRGILRRQVRRLRRLLSPTLRRPDLIGEGDLDAGLDVVYRFLLGRGADEGGRRHYLRLIHDEGLTLREIAVEIAASDEFQRRLKRDGQFNGPLAAVAPPENFADVRELITTLTVEELAETAEDYYRRTLDFADGYLAKPLADPHEAPELLGSFAHLLGGLRLAPGMAVLDFGAGTCWTTRFLTQLGCAVTAVDVSPTALGLGRDLFARLPPIGDRPEPRFLVFDGHHLDLPDAGVDRIVCFDAFHHVPNPAAVLRELARVLRPGGIAGFSEPGPNHSKAARSQYEMKNFTALENDVVMADIWRWARAAGFSGLELAIFSTESCRVSLQEFEDLVAGGPPLDEYGERLRGFLTGHQTFFLTKGEETARDSRELGGLRGAITVRLERIDMSGHEHVRGQATVRNVGDATWLPGHTPVGGVNLGVHLRSRDGRPLDVDFRRIVLETSTKPGEAQAVGFAFVPPPPGEYLLEFDLVSEGIGWFEMNGSATATVAITVR